MNVLGLDVGFSITKATNSFCLLNVDEKRKEIGLVEPAKRFLRAEAPDLFRRLSRSYPEIRWVSVDAPLTPLRLTLRLRSGRSVDKRFSNRVFHGSRRGPQPGSISVPLQGWPLYEAAARGVRSGEHDDDPRCQGLRVAGGGDTGFGPQVPVDSESHSLRSGPRRRRRSWRRG